MSTIRPEFHTSLITQTINDIFYQRSSLYYFLGKIEAWGTTGEEPPSAPLNTLQDDVVIRNNIAYLRKVAPSEVSLVTTRYGWVSGTVYSQWDHTKEMKGLPFYVVTDEFNVYKCLDNNSGAVSTVKPTTNSLFPFRTADGYLWKYMYNIPSFKRTKFLSRNNLPVQKALTDTFYNKGAVEQVVVTNGGSGYTDLQLTNIVLSGGTTTGSGGTAEIGSVSLLGQITGLNVIDGGSDYTAGALVTIDSETGSGAQIKIITEGGVITGFDIINPGVGYKLTDTVTISVGGAILTPVVSQQTGSILKVIINNAGAGYTSAPAVSLIQSPNTGTGKYGNDDAVIKPVIFEGSIVNITIEDPGVNYPADNATTVVVSGDGINASFSPVVYNGEVVDIVVENPGSDYSFMKIDIVGAGTGATAEAVIAASDFKSDQSSVEQVAVKGAIYSIVVTEPGNNYSQDTTISIVGDGTGATAQATIVDGVITKITMISYGQNYTNATITAVDPNRPVPNTYTDLQAYAILPPINGHGYDAVKELYADTLSVFTSIRDDTELNLLLQDYRQYGLLSNPTNLFTNKIITTQTSFPVFTVTLSNIGDLVVDAVLVNNNKRYRIVSITNNVVKMQQLNPIYAQPSGVMYDELDPTIQYTIQSVNSVPSANKYSGNLLYVTNNAPFTPTEENSVAIRTYIKL